MKSIDIAIRAAHDLEASIAAIDPNSVNLYLEQIKAAKRIFVVGTGRSLLVMKAFAMRLMHLGFDVFVIGDVTTPAFKHDDLLIVTSASGKTNTLLTIMAEVKKIRGKAVLLTANQESELAKSASTVVTIPSYTDKLPVSSNNKPGILPGGSLFEETVLILGDALIVELANFKNVQLDHSFENHANLE